MRGKKIGLSLCLTLVVLLSTLVMNMPVALAATPTLSVNPNYVNGYPGEIFQVDIDVSDVTALYTWALELHFEPHGYVVAVRRAIEGPFLKQDGMDTFFSYRIFTLEGYVAIGCTRLAEVGGISGSGTLVTVEFKILEAGECALWLANSELYEYPDPYPSPDPSQDLIPHATVDSYFEGLHAEVTGPALLTGVHGDSMVAKVGDTITLASSVTHAWGASPLAVQVRYDLTRRDGKVLTLWSPQPRVIELYVDGYAPAAEDWSVYGTAPFLDAVGDGNYIESGGYCAMIGFFSLEDITMLPGETVTEVKLEAWSKAESGEIDGDVYIFTNEMSWFWAGSIEASSDWGWYFTDADSMAALHDEASINSAEFLLHYWTPDGSSGPTQTVDAIRVTVTTAITATINPGETIDMPLVVYTLMPEDKGKYRSLKATCYYRAVGTYIQGKVEQPIIVLGEVTPRDYLIVGGKPTK